MTEDQFLKIMDRLESIEKTLTQELPNILTKRPMKEEAGFNRFLPLIQTRIDELKGKTLTTTQLLNFLGFDNITDADKSEVGIATRYLGVIRRRKNTGWHYIF